ncbi:4'-phosphopantetheinyl transferase family protein [Catalinimonas niigatensis]|uniref:4'-phosphopantetheinyl transferase family protein n=1 Tax=Catalinimonas niigatensis TaxID=1397264 RepID=UPI0026662D86|nr:4'-phosphopantetheinyl transferase superfamily protein [Catalinimonas niigatensis]WPP48056.1 4'-phosphopantetheinyl transferase superfamily protein [Catalinimonas niigatensis]
MALTKIVKINDKLSWALWKIDSSWTELLRERTFSKDEHALLASISHPIKKAEFLASRLALHALLSSIGIDHYIMQKDEHGKPYLMDSSFYISLANSYPYAAAIVHSQAPIGIDIEKPSDKLIRVQHKFLHETEWMTFKDNPELLCLAWCAKESLYKLHGRKNLSFKGNICIREIDYPQNMTLKADILLPNHTQHFDLKIVHEQNFFILFNV